MLLVQDSVTTEDGVRLSVIKLGDGPNAVIIPNAVHMFDSFQHLAAKYTVIFFDLRNRGRSEGVSDSSRLTRGIHHDVDDVEAVRRHFGIGRVSLLGHSYLALSVILYALKYAAHVDRVVQIGPPPPDAGAQYPAHLTGADATLADFLTRLAELQKEGIAEGPEEFCKKFWALIKVLYVVNPADADKIQWTPCDFPNEYLNFMRHWTGNILPSIQALKLCPEDFARVTMPVLTIHGTRDRQSPYGGGRDWALRLPNARLFTVANAAHVPWIEAPETVFGAIETFFDGQWPNGAEAVGEL